MGRENKGSVGNRLRDRHGFFLVKAFECVGKDSQQEKRRKEKKGKKSTIVGGSLS